MAITLANRQMTVLFYRVYLPLCFIVHVMSQEDVTVVLFADLTVHITNTKIRFDCSVSTSVIIAPYSVLRCNVTFLAAW